MMSPWVTPLRRSPLTLRSSAFAWARAWLIFLSEALAPRDRRRFGFDVSIANVAPSDSFVESNKRRRSIYSSNVSIMLRSAKWLTSSTEQFRLDKGGVNRSVCFGTDTVDSNEAARIIHIVCAINVHKEVIGCDDADVFKGSGWRLSSHL